MTRAAWIFAAALTLGCSARFVDERPEEERRPLIPDGGGAQVMDLPPAGDMDTGRDLGAGAQGVVLASGTFVGRAGHGGKGGGSIYRRPDGQIEVRMASDFGVTGVVGPVVVLTSRQDLGSMLRPQEGDLELGALRSTSGEQSYLVPGGDGGRRVVFIWCKPFTVEIAKAVMEAR
jgi:hypothetical protein